MTDRSSRLVLIAALMAGLVGVLPACSPNIESHGDLPQADHLAQIEPGRTRSDVLALLGTPSTTFSLDADRWYYISNQTKEYTWHQITEVSRQVIIIDFDKSGTVTAVKKLNLDNGETIAMVDRVTPTQGNGLSLLGQLVGNIGRFDTSTATK
jgi:outer membrane protein assembly factor BamE (lipoprotein component of BamABCDE complex)